MGFFQDIVAIFQKRELALIECVQESAEIYTFRFEKAKDITWTAGQHGLFTITHQKIKDHTRPFTIASAPAEGVIQLTMKIGNSPSAFKQAMLSLQKGDAIKMAGPVGSFSLQEASPAILIAGGIGITPFRSILKQIEVEDRDQQQAIQLFYMDSSKSYLFQTELDQIAEKSAIQISYFHERDQLNNQLNKCLNSDTAGSQFFVAGPKAMVEATTAYLQQQKIPKQAIKKDILIGY